MFVYIFCFIDFEQVYVLIFEVSKVIMFHFIKDKYYQTV